MAKKRAAVYIRMSSEEQDKSPEQQQTAIDKLIADNNYRVVETYSDLGISGDRTEDRYGFQQLIADAQSGAFDVVVAWHQDRIGRFNMIEMGEWLSPLMKRGVLIHTCVQGEMDLRDPNTQLLFTITQHASNAYCRSISSNVTRSHRQIAERGEWVGGRPTLGYVVGDDRHLAPGDPADVEAVRQIFQRYANGKPVRQIIEWLRSQGVKSSRGTDWTNVGVRDLLKNKVYIGDLPYGKRTDSKYLADGSPDGKKRTRNRNGLIVKDDAHEAIIDRKLFEAVQDRFEQNKRLTVPGGKIHALTGLVRCHCCGSSMTRDVSNKKPGLLCHGYVEKRCERRYVLETTAIEAVADALSDYFERNLSPKNVKRVKAEMRKILSGERTDAKRLKASLAKIENQIERAETRLLEVAPDMVDRVQKQIRKLEDQRDETALRLESASRSVTELTTALDERVAAALSWLDDLRKAITGPADGEAVNGLLGAFVETISLDIDRQPIPGSKRCRTVLVGGKIRIRSGGLGVLACGDSASSPPGSSTC